MLELAEKANQRAFREAQHQAHRDPDPHASVAPNPIEITRARFDPALPERAAINDGYVELLQAADQNAQLIPYQDKFEDFRELVTQAVASQQQPPAYTRKLIELDNRLTADLERRQEIETVQNDIVDLHHQLRYLQHGTAPAEAGLAESTPLYNAFVEDCTRCLVRWTALQDDPEMQAHLEHLEKPFLDTRVEVLAEHARYTAPAHTATAEVAEEATSRSQHPIVRKYLDLLERADNKPELLAYQAGFDEFRDTVRQAQQNRTEHPEMVQALGRLSLRLDQSDTNRNAIKTLSEHLLQSTKDALALETWAADQPGRKIQNAPKYEKWRERADALLDEYRSMARDASYAPHMNDREEARQFFDRRIAYISEQRFAPLPKQDPTKQQALHAQQTQEAEQGFSMSM